MSGNIVCYGPNCCGDGRGITLAQILDIFRTSRAIFLKMLESSSESRMASQVSISTLNWNTTVVVKGLNLKNYWY